MRAAASRHYFIARQNSMIRDDVRNMHHPSWSENRAGTWTHRKSNPSSSCASGPAVSSEQAPCAMIPAYCPLAVRIAQAPVARPPTAERPVQTIWQPPGSVVSPKIPKCHRHDPRLPRARAAIALSSHFRQEALGVLTDTQAIKNPAGQTTRPARPVVRAHRVGTPDLIEAHHARPLFSKLIPAGQRGRRAEPGLLHARRDSQRTGAMWQYAARKRLLYRCALRDHVATHAERLPAGEI